LEAGEHSAQMIEFVEQILKCHLPYFQTLKSKLRHLPIFFSLYSMRSPTMLFALGTQRLNHLPHFVNAQSPWIGS